MKKVIGIYEGIGNEEMVEVKVKTLYEELMEDTDEFIQEFVSCKISEDDSVLNAVLRSKSNNTVYIYNYFRNDDGTVERKTTSVNKSMLVGLFQVA